MIKLEKPAFSRLLLCDPVCVFPYGHNVAAMDNFRHLLGKYYAEIVCLGCRELPEDISVRSGIERVFQYYYNDVMPLASGAYAELSNLPQTHVEKIAAAKSDLARILKEQNVNSTDTICYPSIDFYSLYALADSIDALKEAGSPTLLIRMIYVMECAASVSYGKPFNVIFSLLNRLIDAGVTVRLAAETPRYAQLLAENLGRSVAVAANIELREQLPLPDNEYFTVICPGSARYDKGFLNLFDIFHRVRAHDPNMRIRFITQTLPDRDLKHQMNYLVRLYSTPGTTILPSQLSAEQLVAMYKDADLVLLPYAHDVYHYRGSAVMIEAICSGRYCLTLDGPAFVDQMRYFGGGDVCSNLTDMADRIVALSKEPSAVRYAKSRQTRERFVRDLISSYHDWVM